MARGFVFAGLIWTGLTAACLHAQVNLPPPPPAPEPVYAPPPEADESIAVPRVYTFNPLQAKKEIEVGDFNARRGNFKGAAQRFREATLWDDANSDAFFKLGDASERLKDYPSAKAAFTKFIQLAADKKPEQKKVADIKARIAKYPASADTPKVAGPVKLDDALKSDRGTEGTLRSKGIVRLPPQQ
ncbi:MAG: hypothetical protein ABI995_11730 [Acidobacteriota bacterium]